MNGTQCGFCSPGFVMNMHSLLESKNYKVTMDEIENAFGANLCRCTGYRPILDAMKSFACDSNIYVPEKFRDIEDLTGKMCLKSGISCVVGCRNTLKELSYTDGNTWYWPKTMDDLFAFLSKINTNEEYMLVAGNTAHGVYRRSQAIKHFVDINGIADLQTHKLSTEKLSLGANLSLTETMDIYKDAADQPGFEYCLELWRNFDLIANVPVRNVSNYFMKTDLGINKQLMSPSKNIILIVA